MKLTKLLLFVLIIFLSNNLLAQDEDYFAFMGASKADILKVYSEDKRIVNGEYYELAFSMNSDTDFHFYFDSNLLCNKVIVQKSLNDFENAKLILSGDFPKQGQGNDTFFYWNSKMMATLMKLNKSIIIAYEKVRPELLKK
jgi:hypothetical protein